MRVVSDMLGRVLSVPLTPERIVSLCPSQTETLFDLGLGDRVVGTTRYCIHPQQKVESTIRVGGTKRVDLGVIRRLKPDLIIAEKEENPREMVEALSELAPVYVTNVENPASAFQMITRLGALTGAEDRAEMLVREIQAEWSQLPLQERKIRIAYLIWRKPWMAAGPTTYIDALLEVTGFENVFGAREGAVSTEVAVRRYPELTPEQLAQADPEVVLLSSEPYPFQERHLAELQALLPRARVLLTDGEPWSWYGSRMRAFPALVRELHQTLAR